MTTLRRGDADLHHEDGSHWSTAPTANGRALVRHERRISEHLAAHNAANSREAEQEPKRLRTRLAKAELWFFLAVKAQEWANDVGDRDHKTIPFGEWPPDDPMVDLAARYGLSGDELAKCLDSIADQLEQRSLRRGYEEAWIWGAAAAIPPQPARSTVDTDI